MPRIEAECFLQLGVRFIALSSTDVEVGDSSRIVPNAGVLAPWAR